jgi:putative oxidoreductase
LRNTIDFLAALSFPQEPLRDTNRARHEVLGTTMDKINKMFAAWEPMVLSIFRIVTGLMLFQYGVAKLFKFPAVPYFAKVEVLSLYGIAGTFELILGGLLILGLFTRLAAFILSGEMAFAYFIDHFPKSFFPLLNGGTLAIVLCFACLYLATAGGGPYSLDATMRNKS